MGWRAYQFSPIDFGWEHLKTVAETISFLSQNNESFDSDISALLSNWALAKELAKKKGWEGDFREEPRVFWFPSEYEMIYGFVFKQDSNGSTFIVSPVEFPFLKE
jgi:hypothetical protein